MYQRKNIRLYSHDYDGSAWYFVTIKIYQNEWLFGNVINGIMRLNKLGEIVQNELLKTSLIPKNVSLDEFIIMPNYLYALIKIKYKIKNSSSVLQ
jgi:REP element-mobilizing transposase RayT